MLLGALALGVLIGLSLGALGGGGSILTVPALVFVLGLTAQQATAGSLVIVGVTAVLASIGHARVGNTRWGRGATLALVGVPASVLGSELKRCCCSSSPRTSASRPGSEHREPGHASE